MVDQVPGTIALVRCRPTMGFNEPQTLTKLISWLESTT